MSHGENLVILGGGIKGCALAALASLSGRYNVVLVERNGLGSGATSVNHGRLHAGTAGFKGDSDALIQRRFAASKLICSLPDVLESTRPGLYTFEDRDDSDLFVTMGTRTGVPVEATVPQRIWHRDDARYGQSTYAVPEYGFNPARLAGRLAHTAERGGAQIVVARASTIERATNGTLRVHLSDGDALAAHHVVNTMARWSEQLEVPHGAPRPHVTWHRWGFFALRAGALPDLPRLEEVVMLIDRSGSYPSAIPHGEWMTLDYKATDVTTVTSPERSAVRDLRRHAQFSEDERGDWNIVREGLPSLARLDTAALDAALIRIYGLHGRRTGAGVGSANTCETSSDVPGYMVAFGGQASTGVLDALEILGSLENRPTIEYSNLVATLRDHLAATPHKLSVDMIWNDTSQMKSIEE